MSAPEPIRFVATERCGEVSGLLQRPIGARALLVLGHGAGAGMHHAFMDALCERLAARSVGTFRYQFPYMESGKRRVDPRPIALATVRSAVAEAARRTRDLPIFAGGKSFGGRMTSLAAAESALPDVRGIAFVGFPLHPAGKPAVDRADHLSRTGLPLLFLQGGRDKLADLALLRPICTELGGRATLHVVDAADHGFSVLKRSGRTAGDVLDELASQIGAWTQQIG